MIFGMLFFFLFQEYSVGGTNTFGGCYCKESLLGGCNCGSQNVALLIENEFYTQFSGQEVTEMPNVLKQMKLKVETDISNNKNLKRRNLISEEKKKNLHSF